VLEEPGLIEPPEATPPSDTPAAMRTLGKQADPNPMQRQAVCLKKAWRFADTQCTVTPSPEGLLELRSARIFLDPAVERAARAVDPEARPLLTYIANLITAGTNATPYSMVTAAGPPWTPPDLANDEIVLNQWLADDLQAAPGDWLTLVYYDPESGVNLTERSNRFRVHSVVPMEFPWADRSLMPDFPGIEKAERTADWDTTFPLTYKIRPQDDDYWQQYRGTPKAFVSLAAGKAMWQNRFGSITAMRFPVPSLQHADSEPTPDMLDAFRRNLEGRILENLDPGELGLRFQPVRQLALQAASESQDFGGLFIGFSLFLIAAALILMALLFRFGLEQRATEVGTLLALGFTHQRLRRLLLAEGAALAFLGGVLGTIGGVIYAKAMLLGLTTVWSDAVGGTTLQFFITPVSLGLGLASSTLVAAATLWLALRRQTRLPAHVLLTSNLGLQTLDLQAPRAGRENLKLLRLLTNTASIGTLSLVAALGLVGMALARGDTSNAGVFFGAGALILIFGLSLMTGWLSRMVKPAQAQGHPLPEANGARPVTVVRSSGLLAWRAAARRRTRSVATAALLAGGSFLILSIGVFRLDATRDATQPTSGTGGFALIGEAAVPVVEDLNTVAGRAALALEEEDLADVRFVPFRVRAGDEASCLNLNRAQQPRLLGVDPTTLDGRFTFAKAMNEAPEEGWRLLQSSIADPRIAPDEIPAIGDLNSILWAMGKKVGETIEYVDSRGRAFKVRIVGAVANSILQGSLVIDEAAFLERFPDASGYQYFLIDAPPQREAAVTAVLSRALQDYGLELTPAARRLNQFNAVQNTYLGTFQILGGLGLLLGSAGLGIVVLRNVLERRGELAVLMALGFRKRRIEVLVLLEHGTLLGCGLAIGVLAAAVAVLPSLISPGTALPYASLGPTVLAVLANGFVWTWAATRGALRGNLLEALRNE
jgi:ABC-type antimicrobial peptide transport system permease subunit